MDLGNDALALSRWPSRLGCSPRTGSLRLAFSESSLLEDSPVLLYRWRPAA
ncbi:hypothetical protein PM082_012281 [Marasmius tenuissimus]|nr:hypothetical protein PM082_012281 [Marasmius tenuissimus]